MGNQITSPGSLYGSLTTQTTFSASGTSVAAAATYGNVRQLSTSGYGVGATFNITKTGAGTAYSGSGVTTVTVVLGGALYAVGDTITISGASLGGVVVTNNLTLTVGTAIQSYPISLNSLTDTTFTNTILSTPRPDAIINSRRELVNLATSVAVLTNPDPDTNRYSRRDLVDLANTIEKFSNFKPANSIKSTQIDRNIVADKLSIKTNKVIGWG
jgi:hypothetical protein